MWMFSHSASQVSVGAKFRSGLTEKKFRCVRVAAPKAPGLSIAGTVGAFWARYFGSELVLLGPFYGRIIYLSWGAHGHAGTGIL